MIVYGREDGGVEGGGEGLNEVLKGSALCVRGRIRCIGGRGMRTGRWGAGKAERCNVEEG